MMPTNAKRFMCKFLSSKCLDDLYINRSNILSYNAKSIIPSSGAAKSENKDAIKVKLSNHW